MMLARYKFVAKMFDGKHQVLEVGCSDGWKSKVVAQAVEDLVGIDIDTEALKDAKLFPWIDARYHDILDGPLSGRFSAAYSLDVLEHIPETMARRFLENLKGSVIADGPVIIGMPSYESQRYASPMASRHHVNCMSHDTLRRTLGMHWHNVFVFGMNDEVLHTGYGPMCHYLLALCV